MISTYKQTNDGILYIYILKENKHFRSESLRKEQALGPTYINRIPQTVERVRRWFSFFLNWLHVPLLFHLALTPLSSPINRLSMADYPVYQHPVMTPCLQNVLT